MTKKEMFETIATVNADNEEIVNFCKHEIELLANRKNSGKRSLTATQKANLVIMEKIVQALALFDHPVTVTELMDNSADLEGYSCQKLSALLKKLVEDGRVVKDLDGKKAFYGIAES